MELQKGEMGVSLTQITEDQLTDLGMIGANSAQRKRSGPGLGDLPESCIASILGRTTPRDVARLACASRIFWAASNWDIVWDKILPHGYADIPSEARAAPHAPPSACSKKEVYNYLSNVVLLENATQEYWLDRATGAVCRSFGARELCVSCNGAPFVCRWFTQEGSRFAKVARIWIDRELKVRGELKSYLPPGTYTLSWRFYLAWGRYGWDNHAVKFYLKATGNAHVKTELIPLARNTQSSHVWMEINVGEFIVERADTPVELKVSMKGVEGRDPKGYVYVDCVVVRPTFVQPKERTLQLSGRFP